MTRYYHQKGQKNNHTTLCWKRIIRTPLFLCGKPIVSFNYNSLLKSCAKERTFNSPFQTIVSVNWSYKFAIRQEAIADPNHQLLPVVRFYVCFIMDQRSQNKFSICKQQSQRDHGTKGCFVQMYQHKGKTQSIFQ